MGSPMLEEVFEIVKQTRTVPNKNFMFDVGNELTEDRAEFVEHGRDNMDNLEWLTVLIHIDGEPYEVEIKGAVK